MKFKDKLKALFAKAQDDAAKMCADEFPDKKEEKKEEKDAAPPEKKEEKKESKDADPAAPALSVEERLAKLEALVASLSSSEVGDADEEEVESDDADSEESEEAEDGYEEKPEKKVGDAKAEEDEEDEEADDELVSRVEILAPGMKAEGRDVKARAVKAAYATKDGKAQIHKFTRGKEPNLKDEAQVETLFVGVSELLKVSRTSDFAKTKTQDANYGEEETSSSAVTPEMVNEANAKRYARK